MGIRSTQEPQLGCAALLLYLAAAHAILLAVIFGGCFIVHPTQVALGLAAVSAAVGYGLARSARGIVRQGTTADRASRLEKQALAGVFGVMLSTGAIRLFGMAGESTAAGLAGVALFGGGVLLLQFALRLANGQ